MNAKTSTITLTLGEVAESHVGMEKRGSRLAAGEGFTPQELETAKREFEKQGFKCEIVSLWKPELATLEIKESNKKRKQKTQVPDAESACILIVRNGVGSQKRHDLVFEEQKNLPVDQKAFMKGRVVNKKARWNLCFDKKASTPDYENKKGRVMAWADVPMTHALVQDFIHVLGPKAIKYLKRAEGNYYYDVKKCGIGFHGDSERRLVAAVRLGAPLDMYYQWYLRHQPVGDRITLRLNGGDMYVMSEKAVGTDWMSSKFLTLRHATGAASVVDPISKKRNRVTVPKRKIDNDEANNTERPTKKQK